MALVSKTFSQIITFTRTGTGATYFDATGVLTAAAPDQPRLDYNPATLAAQGLLIEEARTNLLTYSAQFDNAAWTKETSVSVSANTTVAPDGTTTGDTVTADQDRAIYQSVTATIGTTYCQSVFIKAGTATSILFRDDTGAGRNIIINPSTGAITGTGGTLVTSGSQAIGNGWWRYWFAYVADTTTVRGLLRPNAAGAAQTFIVWGAQTEAGAFPTSYIPTTTMALTRSADVASVNTLSPWYNASEGTLFAVASSAWASANVAGFSDGTNSNRIIVGTSSGPNARLLITTAGVTEATISVAYSLNTVAKFAGAYKLNSSNFALNGALGTEDTACVMPSVNRLSIGTNTTLNDFFLNGWIQRFTYYPRRLSNAELQAITA